MVKLTKLNDLNLMEHTTFEIYTVHPDTGESGWDIKWVAIEADKKTAIEMVKNYPNFDCIISINDLGWNMKEINVYSE